MTIGKNDSHKRRYVSPLFVDKMKVFLAALILALLLIFTMRVSRPGVSNEVKVFFNQSFIEGRAQILINWDVSTANVDEVFGFVFSNLNRSVVVYPSSNYYYFKFISGGKEFWGNIALSPADRNRGLLNFVYYEFTGTSDQTKSAKTKKYGLADGVVIQRLGDEQYSATYRGKTVIFNLYPLKQNPPPGFLLKKGEVFIERMFDESGYQFSLFFNTEGNYFMWLLNEETKPPDILEVHGRLAVGRKSGFVFYEDGARKILIGVKAKSMEENNYYDGPHDQLADNYADETRVSDYIQLAYPRAKGKIDKYGWFMDGKTGHLAIAPYYLYSSPEELEVIVNSCGDIDFYICITNNRNRN